MISRLRIDDLSEKGDFARMGTRMDHDLLLMRDVIIELIESVHELDDRLLRAEGLREPL